MEKLKNLTTLALLGIGILFLLNIKFDKHEPLKNQHTKNRFPSSYFKMKSPLDLEQVKKFLNQNDSISLEKFISELPIDYRRFFTLVYKSQSLQKATYEEPRAILFGLDSSLVMSFGGSNNLKRGNFLEIMSFDKNKAKFSFFEISFPYNKLNHWVKNPKACMNCHAAYPKAVGEPKPIWQPYPRWPGAYGSINDNILTYKTKRIGIRRNDWKQVIEESKNFLKFKENDMDHPRYKYLVFNEKIKEAPYRGRRSTASVYQRPNMLMGLFLTGHNALKTVKRISETKIYKKYKYSLLSLRLGCTKRRGFSAEAKKFVLKDINKHLYHIYPMIKSGKKGSKNLIEYTENDIPPLYYNWNMDFQETIDSYFNGLSRVKEHKIVDAYLYQELMKEDLELKNLYRIRNWVIEPEEAQFFRDEDLRNRVLKALPLLSRKNVKKTCKYLNTKVLQEIENFKNDFSHISYINDIKPAYYIYAANPFEEYKEIVQSQKLDDENIDKSKFSLHYKKVTNKKMTAIYNQIHNNNTPEIKYGCYDCHSGPNSIFDLGIKIRKQTMEKSYTENEIDLIQNAITGKNQIGNYMPLGQKKKRKNL